MITCPCGSVMELHDGRYVCDYCDKLEVAALTVQVGGDHYKNLPIQPVEYAEKNRLSYCEGNVVKYITRWRSKNGIEDLRKARHYLDILIEMAEQEKKSS